MKLENDGAWPVRFVRVSISKRDVREILQKKLLRKHVEICERKEVMSETENKNLEPLRKKFKPPKTLGACIDKLYALRRDRQALQRDVDAIGDQETLMREHIIATFSKTEINGARGKTASCSISPKRVPTVKDWSKLYEYIRKHKAFDLLQRRVHEGAWKERLNDGKVVPGVEAFDVVALSLTKL